MGLRNAFVIALLLFVSACESSGGGTSIHPGPYKLSYALDTSFRAPHGDEPIRMAVVRMSDGLVMAEEFGTVSATENPSFAFSTDAIMERGKSYAVHFWIDSNIGGGTLGLCDSTDFDHQWSTEFFTVTNDINFTVGYEPSLVEYVCNTFP